MLSTSTVLSTVLVLNTCSENIFWILLCPKSQKNSSSKGGKKDTFHFFFLSRDTMRSSEIDEEK